MALALKSNAVAKITQGIDINHVRILVDRTNLFGELSEGDSIPAVIYYERNTENPRWVNEDSQPPDYYNGLLSLREEVDITRISQTEMTVVRGTGGTAARSWDSNPREAETDPLPNPPFLNLMIACVIRAQDLKIVEGVVNQDIVPDANETRSLGSAMKMFANIFSGLIQATSLNIGGTTITGGSNVNLTLPRQAGRLARIEDVAGFSGSVAVDQASVSGTVALRGGDFNLVQVIEIGDDRTILAAVSLAVLNAIFEDAVRVGGGQSARFDEDGAFNGSRAANLKITDDGGVFFAEFDTIDSSSRGLSDYNALLEATTITNPAETTDISALMAKYTASKYVSAHSGLFVRGYRQPITHIDGTNTAPGMDDDESDGFAVGDRWHFADGTAEYVCTSAAAGAAVWRQIRGQATLWTGNASSGTHSLSAGQKFSDWRLLSFYANSPAPASREAATVIREEFVANPITLFHFSSGSGGGVSDYVNVTHVSDSSFSIQERGSSLGRDNNLVKIYGIN